ncbi:hypothetical protein [Vagococcus zengguangii]|uniref:Uncharacterized protein n=1 Tax=Vagococcus zengguangii TaxID=2571750 RepID=A0A4D7CT59_9ENTE|nr:hypothetical protein [Vagococcus zengguangii]QCI85982.1 hypothetical protein FA707_02955 [Vagococcus zengguangii]TLG80273.1 hypothetical protein FE258_06190 [Vagococcus zengguangii]
MEISELTIGESYTCKSPLFNKEFTGIVEKIYDLSAMVTVNQCNSNDSEKADDLNGRLIVAARNITNLCKKPQEA